MEGTPAAPTVVSMVTEHPSELHVLVAGGGVAALETVLALRAAAGDRVRLALVAPDAEFSYRPLAVAEPFALGSIRRLSLDRFCAAHGVRRHRDTVVAVDTGARVARTRGGDLLAYDALVLASGARTVEAVPGALTYRGEQDAERLRDVLAAAVEGRAERLAFLVPRGASWPLPMYELAVMTARWLRAKGARAETTLVTAEHAPLSLFGPEAASSVQWLLRRTGVRLRAGVAVDVVEDGRLWIGHEAAGRVDRAIALPGHLGRAPQGIPHDARGFVEVDDLCRVRGVDDVLAVGDLTAGAVKQGGLATQQADTAAAVLARRSGAPVVPAPYRPVLRGLLLTGEQPTYLRRALGDEDGTLAHEPLWWPPHKIAGRHLGPYLAGDLDLAAPVASGHLPVDLELAPLASRR